MKDKKLIIVIVVSVLLIIGLFFLTRGSRSVNWQPTFYNTSTEPYGTYIAFELTKDIFDKKIEVTRKPIYNNLKYRMEEFFYYEDVDEYSYDYEESDSVEDEDPMAIFDATELTDTTAYIFINYKFELDDTDLEYLLDFVGVGNNVFISAEHFDRKLMDTLDIKTTRHHSLSDSIYTMVDYDAKKYGFPSIYYDASLDTDSTSFEVRTLASNKDKEAVFVRLTFGKGNFYLHTVPSAFTNLHQLKIEKYDFAYRCLSYIPKDNYIIWDEYQTQGLVGETSIFRVLLNDDALRASLYLTILGFFLFMIFRAKRIQRIIPIIKPPVNSSIEFLDTVSNLYYHKKDLDTIVEKRHAYFLDYIRRHYYMPTERIDNEFVEALAAKSGVDKDILNEIFVLFSRMRGEFAPVITNEDFLRYNSLLEDFYKKVKLVNK
jgi:hypothetical protein